MKLATLAVGLCASLALGGCKVDVREQGANQGSKAKQSRTGKGKKNSRSEGISIRSGNTV